MVSHTINAVYVAQHAVDFRKRIVGLISEARSMDLDPYAGECVVFVHPSRRKVRVLGGDCLGAWLIERWFEGGRLEQDFPFMVDPAFVEISVSELAMLLDGAAFCVQKRAKKWV